jgi:hypothetical protein
MTKSSRSSFAPDLELPDFYLSGKVKNALTGAKFEDKNELLASVSPVFTTIFPGTFPVAVGQCLLRSDICVQEKGEYVE